MEFIKDGFEYIWDDYIYPFLFKEYRSDTTVYGREYKIKRTLNTGNIALLLAIVAIILIITLK
ncbi:MAG: hypothetical protein WC333_02425 [Dehalococcoidia bacterium]